MDPEVIPKPPRAQMMKELKEWIEVNCKPRIVRKPPPISRGPRKNLSDFGGLIERLIQVPKNKKYIKPSKDPRCWAYKMKHLVKPEALNYTPSPRIIELAEPLKYEKCEIPPLVRPSALLYKATDRINSLSQPHPRMIKELRHKKKPKRLKGKEKKAKVSKRIVELALPTIRKCTGINENPFEVNPIALKYKASKAIKRLAKPNLEKKVYIDKPVVANMKLAREKYMKLRLKKKPVEKKESKPIKEGKKSK